MDAIKLTALRDFAIRHFPRAQTVKTSLPTGDYERTLYGFAALVDTNAPATQQAAVRLLRTVMSLSIEWEAEGKLSASERLEAEYESMQAAHALCDLTGTTIPWLAAARTPPPTILTTPPAPAIAPSVRPLLQPGPNQSTKDAARYLGVTEQCMRSWASKGDGPITPIKKGSRNGWPTADLVVLAETGWKSRRKYALKPK